MARFKKVPLAELVIDHSYQRPLDERRVARMVADFRPEMLGVLEVSRHNGKCAVFDGQHRLAAAREIGLDALPCMVHENLDQSREAERFVRLQRERKSIHPVQAFVAGCVAGDPTALAIKELATRFGYVIASHRDAETISAVKTLERIFKRGNLAETLELLALWSGDLGATDGTFLDGLSLLVRGYGHRLTKEVRAKLEAVSATVIVRNALSRQARSRGHTNTVLRGEYVLTELRKVADLQGAPRGKPQKRRVDPTR